MITFKEYLQESEELVGRVLSIGINPDHEKHREDHRQEIHDMIRHAYKSIGGYGGLGHGTEAESKAIHTDISDSLIKATKRNGKITAVNLYKQKHGRKSIASAMDGTEQGKKDYIKTKLDDHEQKRAWGEVSGAVEKIQRRIGVPVIPNRRAKELLGKDVDHDQNGEHYTRDIGGDKHTKVMMGHPKK